MKDRTIFIFKVLILSTLLAILTKYGGKLVVITPTMSDVAIAIICLPLLVSLLLGWRWLAKSFTIRR